MEIVHVVGTRPNFMKIAPIIGEMARFPGLFKQLLVHTGQHYDDNMSSIFFDDLSLREPDISLNIGSGSHAEQTARVMLALEPILIDHHPDWVVVVGDVNSTLAAAVVASKLSIKLAHVEAGLRSFDRSMPEEINRLVTDQLADLLFTTEPSAGKNLAREGVPADRCHFVGNVMIDSLVKTLANAQLPCGSSNPDGAIDQYVLATFHRASTTDNPDSLKQVLLGLSDLAVGARVVFPMHPRTRKRVEEYGWNSDIVNLQVTEPLGYLEFLTLMQGASVVITDSGGIQEETTFLGVPCLTVRPNTERPITITRGTNRLIECRRHSIVQAAQEALRGMTPPRRGGRPDLWDGRASQRIVDVFRRLAEDAT